MPAHLPRILLCLAVLLSSTSAYTQAYDTSSSIFRFHQKMAKRGMAESQQKLGLMYETGSGARQSMVNARLWYKQAAAQNYKPALNRLTYLEIKQSGYTDEHKQWLKKLKKDAGFNESEALFLLGQMYSEGTGVTKSLTRSLELLRKAAAGNIPGSESQIAKVEEELAVIRKQYARQKKNTRAIPLRKAPVKKASTAQVPSTKTGIARQAPLKPRTVKAPSVTKAVAGIPAPSLQIRTRKPPPAVKPATTAKQQNSRTNTNNTANANSTRYQKKSEKTASRKQDKAHPMDTVCGGRNRFSRACRQY